MALVSVNGRRLALGRGLVTSGQRHGLFLPSVNGRRVTGAVAQGLEAIAMNIPGIVFLFCNVPGQGPKWIDHSGRGNNAAISGSVWYRQGNGLYTLYHDGSDDGETIANPVAGLPVGSSLRSGFFLGYYTNTSWNFPRMISYGVNVSRNLNDFSLDSTGVMALYENANDAHGSTVITNNVWNTLGFSVSGTKTVTFYLNGAVDASGDTTNTQNTTATAVGIGYSVVQTGNVWKGYVGLALLVNGAMTAAQFKWLDTVAKWMIQK